MSRDSELVLLSSQHPIRGSGYAGRHHGIGVDAPALSEIISIIRPDRTYFFPHDLSEPFHDVELIPLREVTAIIIPDERFWYLARFAPTVLIGWPKQVPIQTGCILPPGSAAFLPSAVIMYASLGPAAFQTSFSAVLDAKLAFKLPDFPELHTLRTIFLDAGCPEIPAATQSSYVISRYPTIVSNSVSSIVTESALAGVDTICVADGCSPLSEQIALFGKYPNVDIVVPERLHESLKGDARGRKWPSLVRRFDLDLFVSILNRDSPV